jgi:hypothetical protein
VGVDEDNNLVTTPLPSSIVLVTPPTKMDYNDGEAIDLSGAVVTAKMADGTTWTDTDHPNGHVSCTPEPAVADKSAVTDPSSISDLMTNLEQPIKWCTSFIVRDNWHSVTGVVGEYQNENEIVVSGGRIIPVYHSHNRYVAAFIVSDSQTVTITTRSRERRNRDGTIGNWGEWRSDGPRDYNLRATGSPIEGKQVYSNYYWLSYYGYEYNSFGLLYTSDPNTNSCWTVVFGTISGGGEPITLNWARPGDGKVLSTTMQIMVGAHTSTGSSGTEGSGGGGEF